MAQSAPLMKIKNRIHDPAVINQTFHISKNIRNRVPSAILCVRLRVTSKCNPAQKLFERPEHLPLLEGLDQIILCSHFQSL